jgi:4-hydroxybenzoate polyprenyltransferase
MQTIWGLFRSVRPRQWSKNLILFAGLIFSRSLTDTHLALVAVLAFLLFCLASGAIYLLNDVIDLEHDRAHPIKKHRAIASGQVSVGLALGAAVFLGLVSLGLGLYLDRGFGYVLAGYLALMLLYSVWLKQVVILDVLAIALGFVLRAVAGGVVIHVEVSSWLLVCTVLLALFLGLGKRRHELVLMEDSAGEHRQILKDYSPYLLDQMIAVVTASTVVAYALYTMSSETVTKFGTKNLEFTIPFVLYGIFRYLYLIHQKKAGGSPERVLLSDRPLLLDIALWAVAVGIIVYLK